MILKRDPLNVILIAVGALGIVASLAVTVMFTLLWDGERGGPWSVWAVWCAGLTMVMTWVVIYLAGAEYNRPDGYPADYIPEPEQAAAPRKLQQLPDGFQTLAAAPPVNWPNIARGKIHGAIQAALRTGYVSVRVMRRESKCNEIEAGIFRDWCASIGAGEIDGKGACVITADGKDILDHLSPRGLMPRSIRAWR